MKSGGLTAYIVRTKAMTKRTISKALIIGYGSIAKKHESILKNMGLTVLIVSKQQGVNAYKTLEAAFSEHTFDLVLICNETNKHITSFQNLIKLGFTKTLFIEKPIFEKVYPIPPNHFENIFIGYNLRFHPVVEKIKNLISDKGIVNATFHVAQDLNQWRPNRKTTETYSAKKASGGGALRDLSHEIDLMNWLLGTGEVRSAKIKNSGHIQGMDCEDTADLVFQTPKCKKVEIHLDMVNPIATRFIEIQLKDEKIYGDLILNEIKVGTSIEKTQNITNITYQKMFEEIVYNSPKSLATLENGLTVLKQIEMIEKLH